MPDVNPFEKFRQPATASAPASARPPAIDPMQARRAAAKARVDAAIADEIKRNPVANPDAIKRDYAIEGPVNDSALFGILGKAHAGVMSAVDWLSGKPFNYFQHLQQQRDDDDYARTLAPQSAFMADLVAPFIGASAAPKAVTALGSWLAESAAPAVQAVGKTINAATQLQKGQKLANAARIVGAGAAAGAAQAAGQGSDIGTGAETGAIASGTLSGLGKAAGYFARPVKDFFGLTSADGLLKRFTSTTSEEVQKLADDYRARTGAEPTLFELLPLGDREKIQDAIGRMPAPSREKLAGLVQQRGANIGPEIAAQTTKAIAPQQQVTVDQMASDLAKSRGETVPTLDDTDLATKAIRSPLDMRTLRETEANNIMAPHDDSVVVPHVSDLVPTHYVQAPNNGPLVEVESDPDVSALIRRAAGVRRLGDNLTVHDLTDMISDLKDDASKGGVESRVAQQAVAHLEDTLQQQQPESFAAYQNMTDQFAGRMRTGEGFAEGTKSRLRENAPADQKTRNAYETPEGSTGRALGQSARLEQDITAAPDQSLRAVQQIAENPSTQRAISQNLGSNAGEQIADAAQAQSQSAQRLSGLNREQQGDQTDLADLARSLIALSPSALPGTRIRGVGNAVQFFRALPQRTSDKLTDALFSQDPQQVAGALQMMNNAGSAGQEALKGLRAAVVEGALGGRASDNPPAPETDQPQPAPAEANPFDQYRQDQPAPQAQAEDPQFQALFDRVVHQESGGKQTDEKGNPLQSPAGAVGVAQIMPDTAPQAAALAGVPYDEHAYLTDADYNKTLGSAYLKDLLKQFNGNSALAVAAYNAGPENVKKAVAKGQQNWLAYLPEETQNYVGSILQ